MSVRELRRLRKRVAELERQEDKRRNAWVYDWPEGVEIGRTQYAHDGDIPVAIRVARKLKHAVVVTAELSGLVTFMALPLADG